VDDPGTGLVALPKGDLRLIAVEPLGRRLGQVESVRVVSAPPAGRIMMWRNPLGPREIGVGQRRPPRSKWAL
jgi:hypothetical protein